MNQAMQFPGWTNAWTMPIKTRVDMLTTGVRTPVGIKVFGTDLDEIEKVGRRAGAAPRAASRGRAASFYERNLGGLYLDIVPNRDALARYGLTVGDVQRIIEAAIGGAPIGIDRRGAQPLLDQRPLPAGPPQRPRAPAARAGPHRRRRRRAAGWATTGLASIAARGIPELMLAQSMGDGRDVEDGPDCTSAGPAAPSPARSRTHRRSSGRTGSPSRTRTRCPGIGAGPRRAGRGRRSSRSARSRTSTSSAGPPMIRDEGGLLVGYVYVDIDQRSATSAATSTTPSTASREAIEHGALVLPPGYYLKWTGQYEQLEKMAERMKLVIPLTLLIIVLLLYLHFRNFTEVLIVLLSIPFALVGSVWLLWLLDYRLSTAVWVGIIALVGLAAQTGIVMIVYIDHAYERRKAAGQDPRPRRHHLGAHGGHGPARAAEADDRRRRC